MIEQRKRTILEFLYYCAEHSILHRSQSFVKFFDENASIKYNECKYTNKTNREDSPVESIVSINDHDDEINEVEEVIEANEIKTAQDTDIDYYLCGYLYDAALNFSHAVQEEANAHYKTAFELYKSGIDKLLTGAKNDTNETRKRIAKTKASKYLEKAEKLYENNILQQEENDFLIENTTTEESQSITSLECPLSHMSRYKVIQVNNRMMKVQDRTDKKIYMMKVIWKTHSQNILFMPQNVPFMCPLLSYFHSENAVFLLLPFVSGGLLWDYIKKYSLTSPRSFQDVEEIFVDPPKESFGPLPTFDAIDADDECVDAVAQLDLEESHDCVDNFYSCANVLENDAIFTPSFDTLNSDIDVVDLMKCSQQLLKSVTKTLEKSVILSTEDKLEEISPVSENDVLPIQHIIIPTKNTSFEETMQVNAEEIKPESFLNIPEIVLQRWASELIISVNSLHMNGIILGDFNLDNLLLGSNGHIQLTYFYQTSRCNCQQLCHLNTRAIKCQYVDFEFPLTKNSDYYSVGIVLYEIFTKTRFYINHPGGIAKYNELQYSEPCQLSEKAKDLLDVLIFKKFDLDSSFESIKTHSFFDDTHLTDM